MDKQAMKEFQAELKDRFFSVRFDNRVQNLVLLVDKETGIEYLQLTSAFADPAQITPLLNPDGTPKINAKWQAGEL